MILKILHYPDPRLREVSRPVEVFDQALKALAENMLETMYDARGIGLAAPQVAELKRLLVIDCRPKDESGRYDIKEQTELEKKITQPLFICNPKILKKEGKTKYDEGCLSVPSFYETVERAKWIELEYQDLEGKVCRLETDGLLAIVIQHEMDHLDGTLFIDRISFTSSQRIKKQIEKFGYPDKKKEKAASSL
jgi:peptide deformylase